LISTRPLPKSSTNCQVSDPRVPRRSFLIARTTERMISLIAKSFHRTSTTKLKTRSLHDKKLRRGLQLLLVPQLPQPRPSDGGTPPRSSARERVLARYSKGPRARKMASARTPIAATKVAAPARFRRPSLRAPWQWDVKRRLRGVEFPVALFDAADALVPGNGGADMIWASALACSGDFLLRLTACQGKDLIAEAR
jgi:hypothetical protein